MFLWISMVYAAPAAMPWSCGPVASPADAWPTWQDGGASAEAVLGTLEAVLAAVDDGTCEEVYGAKEDYGWTTSCCVNAHGDDWCYTIGNGGMTGYWEWSRHWVVRPASGPWSSIELSWSSLESKRDTRATVESSWTATWVGDVDPSMPVDGTLSATSVSWTDGDAYGWGWGSSAAGCEVDASGSVDGGVEVDAIGVGGDTVQVTADAGDACESAAGVADAMFGRDDVGAVTREGWASVEDPCPGEPPAEDTAGGDTAVGETAVADTATDAAEPPGSRCACAAGGSGRGAWALAVALGLVVRRRRGRAAR